jgi:DNA-binding PadR family transcriptional regulator
MIILSDCPCDGNTLDKLLHPAILVALTEGPIHGYRLAERIEQMVGTFGGKPDVSGIYRFLKKMEASGYVVSTWQSGESGHAKRLYELTSDGQACLVRWSATLETYVEAIGNLLREARAASARLPLAPQATSEAPILTQAASVPTDLVSSGTITQ